MEEIRFDYKEELRMLTAEELERRVNCLMFALNAYVAGCLIISIGLPVHGWLKRKMIQKKHEELKERALHAPTEEERKQAARELMELIHKYYL